MYSAGITLVGENVVDVIARLICQRTMRQRVQRVEPFGIRVGLEKGAARALPWDRRGHTQTLRSDWSFRHYESTLPARQEILYEGQSQGREESNGLRLRQAGREAAGNGCPNGEEGYG